MRKLKYSDLLSIEQGDMVDAGETVPLKPDFLLCMSRHDIVDRIQKVVPNTQIGNCQGRHDGTRKQVLCSELTLSHSVQCLSGRVCIYPCTLHFHRYLVCTSPY